MGVKHMLAQLGLGKPLSPAQSVHINWTLIPEKAFLPHTSAEGGTLCSSGKSVLVFAIQHWIHIDQMS